VKLLITGDWHLRATAPESRVDDFVETQFGKMSAVVELAAREKCAAILQPGDMCDHPHLPKYLISRYIRLFLETSAPPIYTVLGQHDIPMRNEESLVKTTSYLFESAGCVCILRPGKKASLQEGIVIRG
jgi:DNA repair exonuclease SbcCD nuclease subunit